MDPLTAVLPTARPAVTDFPALFRTYLHNGVAQALAQVRRHPDLVQNSPLRETVLHTLTFALESATVYDMVREIVQRLTPAMEQAGLWESWLLPLQRAIEQAQQQQDRRAEADWRFWLGQFYQNRSEFAAAHTQWEAAVKLFAALGDAPNQAKTLNRLAYLARLERRYAEGETLVTAALRLLAPTDPERAFSYFVQGVLAFDKSDWASAVAYLQASLTLSEQQGDKVTIARRLRNLGPALRAMGGYAEAIACYQRAIGLFGEVYDPVQQAVTRMNLGVVYLVTDQPDAALACFTEAEAVLRHAQDHWHLAMLYTNQGLACRMLRKWPQAKAYFETALALWTRLDSIAAQVNALDELACTYLEQGDTPAALAVLQQAFARLQQMQTDPAYKTHQENLTRHYEATVQALERLRALPQVGDSPADRPLADSA